MKRRDIIERLLKLTLNERLAVMEAILKSIQEGIYSGRQRANQAGKEKTVNGSSGSFTR